MDKYDFMTIVAEHFEDSASEEEIDAKANQLIDCIETQKVLAKGYLKAGIL